MGMETVKLLLSKFFWVFLFLFITFTVGKCQLSSSKDPFVQNILALKQEAEGDKDGALASYNKAIELEPNNDVHYSNRGMFFANSGDSVRALSDYNKAIQINPKNPVTYDNRGFLKAQIGDTQGALSDYSQAIRIDKGFSPSYNNRAKLYESMGDKKNAINDLKKVADIYKMNGQEAEYQQVIQRINSLNKGDR
jgi:tetratricopeptide (TPR) repeat protein